MIADAIRDRNIETSEKKLTNILIYFDKNNHVGKFS